PEVVATEEAAPEAVIDPVPEPVPFDTATDTATATTPTPAGAASPVSIAPAPVVATQFQTEDATPAVSGIAPATHVVGAGGFEEVGDEIDDEIREVFLEEFAEEIDNLDRLLPLWRAHPEDLDRLRPIRRVFHTLKGSGRLV